MIYRYYLRFTCHPRNTIYFYEAFHIIRAVGTFPTVVDVEGKKNVNISLRANVNGEPNHSESIFQGMGAVKGDCD